MEIRTFLIGSYILGLALSLDTTWINTLKFCSLANQRMSTEDDVVTRNNTWLGKAKYELTWGVITLQVQRVEENETCSEQVCSASKKHCQFCPVKLNESMSSFEELRTMLTPGRKYIIEDSWSRNVKKIPVQTKCLVYRGASNTEYVSCNKSFFDGCSSSDDKPPFKFIIYLEDNSEEGTATYTYFVSSIETGRVPNGSTGLQGSLILALAFFLINLFSTSLESRITIGK